jgi:hypothetical protein
MKFYLKPDQYCGIHIHLLILVLVIIGIIWNIAFFVASFNIKGFEVIAVAALICSILLYAMLVFGSRKGIRTLHVVYMVAKASYFYI